MKLPTEPKYIASLLISIIMAFLFVKNLNNRLFAAVLLITTLLFGVYAWYLHLKWSMNLNKKQ